MCCRKMPDCHANQRGVGSALPEYRNSYASFPRICVIFLSQSRRPSRNAQEDLMGECIVYARLMVEDLPYDMIQILKRCRVEIGLSHKTRQGDGKQSRDRVVMSRTLRIVSGYINTTLHRVKTMLPGAQ